MRECAVAAVVMLALLGRSAAALDDGSATPASTEPTPVPSSVEPSSSEPSPQSSEPSPSSSSSSEPSPSPETSSSSVATPLPPAEPLLAIDHALDDAARLLAGMPVADDSALAALAHRPAVQAHTRTMEQVWTKHASPNFEAVRRFGQTDLVDVDPANVFYPFGGPDILNAVALYPDAATYTLLGLEPVGRFPQAALLDDPKWLAVVQSALANVVRNNLFITHAMARQLKGEVGVAALVSLFLVRAGYVLDGARAVTLDGDGVVVDDVAPPGAPTEAGRVRGVEFVVHRAGTTRPQRVRYFSGNINDEFFSRTPGLVPYLVKMGPLTTVLKAASYLMYYPAFDDIRALVLARSTSIVTDTSGLPFHHLDKPAWQLSLYGTYKAPIKAYADRCEPALKKALHARSKGRLPFLYGYSYPGHNHVIVARRVVDVVDPLASFDGTKLRGEHTVCLNQRTVVQGSAR